MTVWCVIIELDEPDADSLERDRQALVAHLEAATGVRPKTRTILGSSLQAALKPLPSFREIASGRSVLPSFGGMGRKVG